MMRIAISTAFLATLAYAAQSNPRPVRQARLSEGTVDALGACEYGPNAVDCWDMDGRLDKSLVAVLKSGVRNDQQVYFKVGKKNRYLAVRSSQRVQLPLFNRAEMLPVARIRTSSETPVEFFGIAVEKTQRAYDLVLSSNVSSESRWRVAFRPGTVETIEGKSLQIGGSQPVPHGKNPPSNRHSGSLKP